MLGISVEQDSALYTLLQVLGRGGQFFGRRKKEERGSANAAFRTEIDYYR